MSLIKYLNKYYEIQEDILLVSHPNEDSSWGDRCYYLDDNFNPNVHYNHRSILNNEIVIEFDEDDENLNKILIDQVATRLTADNIKWSKWYSGNKSYHLHFFVDMREAKRINILKSVIIEFYGKIGEYKPDLQLAANNHNIRAEHGVHEKTGKKKSLVSQCKNYYKLHDLPPALWEAYAQRVRNLIKKKALNKSKSLSSHPVVQLILNTTEFRKNDDGRERAMFALIHILKSKYKKEELIRFLQDWYKYSGGRKMSPWAIQCKVEYHWNKDYTLSENYLNNLSYELGLEKEETFKS